MAPSQTRLIGAVRDVRTRLDSLTSALASLEAEVAELAGRDLREVSWNAAGLQQELDAMPNHQPVHPAWIVRPGETSPALASRESLRPAPAPAGAEARSDRPAPPVDVSAPAPSPGADRPLQRQVSPPVAEPGASPVDAAEIRMGQTGLLLGGIALALFGIGYFLKYSFDQQWIGPVGRVALTFLGGLVAAWGGELSRRRGLDSFGTALIGASAGVFYFATYAGYQLYALYGQLPAAAAMIGVTIYAAVQALRCDSQRLAILGLLGGYATPVMLSTGDPSALSLFLYITALGCAVVWLASRKGWAALTTIAFGCTWLLFGGWYAFESSADTVWLALIFVQVFFAIFLVAPFASGLGRERGVLAPPNVHLILANSFIAFTYAYLLAASGPGMVVAGCLTLIQAASMAGLAAWISRARPELGSNIATLAIFALGYLVLAAPLFFDAEWVTATWAAQGVIAMAIASRILGDRGRSLFLLGAAVVAGAIGKWVAVDLASFGFSDLLTLPAGYMETLMSRCATFLALASALFVAARVSARQPYEDAGRLGRAFIGLLFGVVFAFANLEVLALSHQVSPDARAGVVSVLWAVFAAAWMVLGFRWRELALRRASLSLFALTAGKVLVFDTARLEIPIRVASLLALGLLMVGASYLYHRHRALLDG